MKSIWEVLIDQGMVDVYQGTNYQIVVELGSLVELGASTLGNWLIGSKKEVGCEEDKVIK